MEAAAASRSSYSMTKVVCKSPSVHCSIFLVSCSDLQPFEIEGLDFLIGAWTRGLSGGVLGDDLGLGKTVQFVRFCLHVCEHSDWRGQFLVLVGDGRAITKWTMEIETDGTWAVLVYVGDQSFCGVLAVETGTRSAYAILVTLDFLIVPPFTF
jgi:hypothetical protein